MNDTLKSCVEGLAQVDVDLIDPLRFGNPRKMSDRMGAALKSSLTEFGVADAVLVRRVGQKAKTRFEILDGHHRFAEQKESGAKKISCLIVDVPDDTHAKALALALNNISAAWDLEALNEYVEKFLKDADEISPTFVVETTGFTSVDIDALGDAGTEFLDGIDASLAGFDVSSHKQDKADEAQGEIEDGTISVSFKMTPSMNEKTYEAINAGKEKFKTPYANVALESILKDFLEA